MPITYAYYGGAFDPPHSGHQRVVLEALNHSGATKLLVAPAYTHPDGKKLAPYNDRISMCWHMLAPFYVRSLDEADVEVSRIEEQLCSAGGKGLTADVIDRLTKPMDYGSFYEPARCERVLLVVGSDVAKAIPTWEGYERLMQQKREGRLDFFEVPRLDGVSSTDARARAQRGEPLGRLVPPQVAKYIEKNNLYKELP